MTCVNPFAIHETTQAIYQALVMEPDERTRRMKLMRAKVANNNVYRWAGTILTQLMHLDIPETTMHDDSALD
ncbi:MAG: trehalose-6-phosphate synthase [Verrucomicrobiaceae bacterium]